MARTRRTIFPQKLNKVDVLIEDTGPRSNYFKISQFDGYFYGGRNAFLLAGSTVLRPRSKVLVEVINKNGSAVFCAPVSTFLEGNSKLYQVEIYKDAPIGPGKIIILGVADSFADGRPVPSDWVGKFNVRWVADVTISPLIKNRTQIRFEDTPELFVEEKFYPEPASSFFSQSINVPFDIEFEPKFFNVFQNGYLAKIKNPDQENRYFTKYLGGKFTGSIEFSDGLTTERAAIDLPISKIFNASLAEVDGRVITTDKGNIIKRAFISSSGEYTSNINLERNKSITSSLFLNYNELVQEDTGSLVSFAKLRIVNLSTLSGEIDKVRFSYKASTDPGGFTFLGEVPTGVTELFADDINNRIVETGRFNDIPDIETYWYSATMSLANISLTGPPDYYLTSSIIAESQFSDQCCGTLLDSINATPLVNGEWPEVAGKPVPYIIGNRETNSVFLFPQSEHTFRFESIVEKTSGSITLDQSDYSLEVYLVPVSGSTRRVLDRNPLGQFIGKLTPRSGFEIQNFEFQEFNFIPAINEPGEYGIRFLIRGGFWNIANVSLKVAEEEFFSPDEIDALLPVLNYGDDIISFKAEFLDVDNNSVETISTSFPTFFTGSDVTEDGCKCEAGNGLLLDDDSFSLDTGSVHFTSGVKEKLNADAVFSSSVQVDHNATANYVSNQHIDHSTVNISAGSGLTGGGTIAASRTLTLDTGSAHFTGGVKSKLNADTVVSSSAQVTTLLPAGTVSSSAQINHDATTNYIANQHIDHTTVSISPGAGMSGGGTIAATRTLTLDTGSAHFTGGVKTKLNTDGVVSGSGQIAINSTTGTLNVDKGGTGQTTYTNGQLLIGNTTGNTLAKATLTAGTGITVTNGSGSITIAAVNNGTVTSIATENGITGGTITSIGTLGLTGQALALHNLATNGIIARTGADTVAGRTITGTTNQVTVTNGDGVSGNPTLSLPQSINTAASVQFGSIGIGTAASGVSGEIRATNEITAFFSDERLKNFHGNIPFALSKVIGLGGYYFTENEVAKSLGYTNDKMQVGVSAQEVQTVLPEAVTNAPISDEYLTVRYEKLIPLLIEAIKELASEVETLKQNRK
jgi:hypothetical protein